MKTGVMKGIMLLYCICSWLYQNAQELPVAAEQQLETMADKEEAMEDDSYLQALSRFRKDPLNLNEAEEDELKELGILTDIQIKNFIQYRKLFGKLVDKYELQAVPGWELPAIYKLLPYITIANPVPLAEDMRTRFSKGDHNFLFRVAQSIGKSSDDPASTGTPQRIFFRYKYNYKRLLQFGITGDKDAGEGFFSGSQKTGFDFYSFHLFMTKKGIIQALAIGDFTVNMGQGLIQWQSMAFKKSAETMSVKRQSPVIRPYNSAGEFNFHRGAGITIRKNKWELTGLFSLRKLSAGLKSDSSNGENYFTSFQTSGYHRTANEIADKNKLLQTTTGATIKYITTRWQVAINSIAYKFSAALQKRNEPYNLYAIAGDRWWNTSIDYSYTCRNLHLFGEAAIDKRGYKAFVNGCLVSVDKTTDISILYRNLAAGYQSLNSAAFTENTTASNEQGFYTGILVRPAAGWELSAYADLYQFPWLKYLVDAPSRGKEFLIEINYTPNRSVEIYTRFKNESRQKTQNIPTDNTGSLVVSKKYNWRTQFNYTINTTLTLRNRMELIWYGGVDNSVTGFLFFIDALYKPPMKPVSCAVRLAGFETTNYDSRIYAYENDLQYNFSIPSFSGTGLHLYFLLNYDLNQKISISFKYAHTFYKYNKNENSNGLYYENDNKSEIKFQSSFSF